MIVLATFVLAGGAAWLHFETLGMTIVPGVTVWIAWYAAVLVALCVVARSRDDAEHDAAVVMVFSFIAAHIIWNVSKAAIITQASRCVIVAMLLFLLAEKYENRALHVACLLHVAVVPFAFLADYEMLFPRKRPMVFIAWYFSDISTGLQHASLIAISMGNNIAQTVGLGGNLGRGHDMRLARVARLAANSREKS